jgi:RimJ/RimL family protein N-acetyltransferase
VSSLPRTIPAGDVELRPLAPTDLGDLVGAINTSLVELGPWFTWAQTEADRHQLLTDIQEDAAAFDAGTDFVFGIFEVSTEELVGNVRVNPEEAPGVAAIGYWVRSDRHRRGYATAAVIAATEGTFAHLPVIQRIEIHMDKANVKSFGVPARAGYVLDREVTREIIAPAHTGHGWVWVADRNRWDAS